MSFELVQRSGNVKCPRVIDLFCGAGLLSHGFKTAGFRPVYAIDLDKKAISSYRSNVGKNAFVSCVRDIPTGIQAEVIVAGPPCQGFSTLGRRDPKDHRNSLGLTVVDWASVIRPLVVVVENVPTFVGTEWFEKMTSRLHKLGYECQTFKLSALDFGAAQRRVRSFTVASSIGAVSPPTLFKSPHKTFRDVVMNKAIANDDPMHIWSKPSQLAHERYATIPFLGGKKDLIIRRPDLCPNSWSKIPNEATDVWGRINPDAPTNTIRCSFLNPSKGRYIHPYENRTLSLREGARLQGIPDSWMMVGEPTPIARQIGNGVPIQLGRAVAEQVMKTIQEANITGYSAAA